MNLPVLKMPSFGGGHQSVTQNAIATSILREIVIKSIVKNMVMNPTAILTNDYGLRPVKLTMD